MRLFTGGWCQLFQWWNFSRCYFVFFGSVSHVSGVPKDYILSQADISGDNAKRGFVIYRKVSILTLRTLCLDFFSLDQFCSTQQLLSIGRIQVKLDLQYQKVSGVLTVDHLPTSASPLNRICWSAQPTNDFMRAKVSFSSFEVRPGGSVGCWPSSAPNLQAKASEASRVKSMRTRLNRSSSIMS